MFIYLITCPSQWYKFWYLFYSDLFLIQPVDQILLTLNRMTKIAYPQNKDGKIRAEKLLQRTASLMSLKFGEIQSLLPGKDVSYESIKTQHWNIPKDLDSTIINHPVHIMTKDKKKTSPSAFIPFCEFGG